MFKKISTTICSCYLGVACAVALYIGDTTPAHAGVEAAKKLAQEPGVIFARELLDVPGKNLVVVKLEIPPKPAQALALPDKSTAHRHPGSVYVYVTKGTVRFGIEGQPAQVVHAGESFFEPLGAVHTIMENTSTKVPALAIAVMIMPDGAPIVEPVESPEEVRNFLKRAFPPALHKAARNQLSSTPCWLSCLVALPFLAGVPEKSAVIIDDVAYTKPQKLVTIDSGRRLNIYCSGSGSPTVVFDSGLGDGTRVWGLIQPAVAKHTRACSYDRAGLGFSDPPAKPSTSANAVDDLHRLLHAAQVKPPYILVGHSLGGMNVKLYAETYLTEVAGVVFVDPSHEDLGKGAWAIDPESQKTYAPYMEALQRCLEAKAEAFVPGSELVQNCGPFPSPRYSAAINTVESERGKQRGRLRARISEQENVWFTSADQVRAAYRPLGAIPIIVLTHEAFPRGPAETQEQRDAKNKLWIDLHDQIATMSTCGKRLTVDNAGHYIQMEQPQAVIGSILEVLQTVQSR